MGKKTKVIAIIMLVFCLGCTKTKKYYTPTITINQEDSTTLTSITIHYNHHRYYDDGSSYITLNTPEDLATYKEQVEFLLKRLDETERRMNIHEPEECHKE